MKCSTRYLLYSKSNSVYLIPINRICKISIRSWSLNISFRIKNNTNHFSCQKNLISIQFLLIFFHVYFWTGRTSKTTSKFKVVHSMRIFSHKPRWISKKLFFKPVFSNSLPFLQKYYLMLKNIWICRWFELWFDVNYRKITIYVRTFEQALLLDLTSKKRAKIVLLVGFDNWTFWLFCRNLLHFKCV